MRVQLLSLAVILWLQKRIRKKSCVLFQYGVALIFCPLLGWSYLSSCISQSVGSKSLFNWYTFKVGPLFWPTSYIQRTKQPFHLCENCIAWSPKFNNLNHELFFKFFFQELLCFTVEFYLTGNQVLAFGNLQINSEWPTY